ncbi:hypothetical protein ABE10_02965, partial [Bacillus toyonensis]|nr:hypothetical protein [Bacillus toyonensis]
AELEGEAHRLGHPVDREVAVHEEIAVVDAGAGRAELHRGVVLDVEEIAGAEVRVTVLVLRVDRGHVDARLHARLQRVLRSDEGRALDPERAAHLRDHHVADAEGDLAVRRVQDPGAGAVAGDVDRHRGSPLSERGRRPATLDPTYIRVNIFRGTGG